MSNVIYVFHIMSYWNKIHNSFGLELYSVLNERVTEREKTDGCRTDMTDTKTPYTRPYTRPGIIIKMFKTSQSQFTKFTGRTLHLSMLVIRHLSFLSIFLHVEAIQFLIFLFPPVAEYPMWPSENENRLDIMSCLIKRNIINISTHLQNGYHEVWTPASKFKLKWYY